MSSGASYRVMQQTIRKVLSLLLPVVMAALALVACNDMYNGNRMKPYEESRFYRDNLSARPIPEGTVARGDVRADALLYQGKINGKPADVFPFPVTTAVVHRGQDRFNTFCSPCHGRLGDGFGMIVRRGFPRPNSFLADSIRAKPVGHYFDVITNGFGRMYSYAPSVPVRDRWAIIAYIRALQLSQHVSVSGLSPAERSTLPASRP